LSFWGESAGESGDVLECLVEFLFGGVEAVLEFGLGGIFVGWSVVGEIVGEVVCRPELSFFVFDGVFHIIHFGMFR